MNIPIYTGTSNFFPGKTPFGFYDNDYHFQEDADRVVGYCARRLGYPIVEIELQDINFYAAFEEAVTIYGNEVYAFKIRQDYLSLEGSSRQTNINDSIFTPNMGTIIRISQQYGVEAGSGGNVDWHTGSIDLKKGQQVYDLNDWAKSKDYDNNDIEIKRVFYEGPPSIVKYFDPYAGTGTGMMNFMDSFGWGSHSPAINFMLMPLNYDIQKLQAIELNDTIRRSHFSFEVQNNKLRIFPIPETNHKLYIQYLLKSERLKNSFVNDPDKVSNISNVPYINPVYSKINSVGRSWIFEYTLALCKETLGYIRGKYSTIPIPDSEVTLNQSDLISSAKDDKAKLIDNLRKYLEDTSREKLLERRSLESEHLNKELKNVPFAIYVG